MNSLFELTATVRSLACNSEERWIADALERGNVSVYQLRSMRDRLRHWGIVSAAHVDALCLLDAAIAEVMS